MAALKEQGRAWPFTVGWIDTLARGRGLGRGLLYCGRWAQPSEAPAQPPAPRTPLTMPITLPSGVLNRFSIGVFNALLYRRHFARHRQAVVDPDLFFYPLDRILRWNLLYGPRGVAQHQSVLPNEFAADGIRAMIDLLRELSATSFLTVIKDCGAEGEGMVSFPRPGMSLALDLPISDNTQEVIDRLNERVIACGGRIYLTKDGCTRPEHLHTMDPRLPAFLNVCRKWDPHGSIRSAQSERLFGADRR